MNTSSRTSGTAPGKATEKWLSDRIVTVYVGSERKKWAVHEKLLTSQSDFFRQAFSSKEPTMITDTLGSGASGITSTPGPDCLDLPDDDPKLFAMAVRWLYGVTFAGQCEFPPVGCDGTDVTVRDYMALYVLAAKLEVEGLKNAAINAVYDYYHAGIVVGEKRRCPDLRDVRFVFEHTPEESQMRRLLIVSTLFYLFNRKDKTVADSPSGLPAEWEEVLRSSGDIAWELIKMLNSWRWVMGQPCPAMTIKKRCSFHEHSVEGGATCED